MRSPWMGWVAAAGLLVFGGWLLSEDDARSGERVVDGTVVRVYEQKRERRWLVYDARFVNPFTGVSQTVTSPAYTSGGPATGDRVDVFVDSRGSARVARGKSHQTAVFVLGFGLLIALGSLGRLVRRT